MMDSKHQKHSDLRKPAYGNFHRQEWAILGTTCSVIQQLAHTLTRALAHSWQVAYIDADHSDADSAETVADSFLAQGGTVAYTDKIQYHRVDRVGAFNAFQYRTWFNEVDLVLVNGNHFAAKRQVVVIDSRKEASLLKRLEQLTQVDLILLMEPQQAPYEFLETHLKKQVVQPLILNLSDTAAIIHFFSTQLEGARPPLLGLVLAGGKSQRMGHDKGSIDYHGMPQREYAATLLAQFCEDVYISVRPDQTDAVSSAFALLPDTFAGLGPMGAILSAFREKPDAAWLVVACDLPMLDAEALQQLTSGRKTGAMATAFNSPVNQFPEPLIAIWEPRSYPILLQFLAQGYSCPRKALINSKVHLLEANDPEALFNVNDHEALHYVKERLQGNQNDQA